MEAQFSKPTEEDYTYLAQSWISVASLIKEKYDYELCQSCDDLKFIQKVIDDELIDFNDAQATIRLGVALGHILAFHEEELDWWVVNDKYGRDLVIRFSELTLYFNALLSGKSFHSMNTI